MALIQKSEPTGLDKRIQDFQSHLYSELGFTDWNCFPRVYVNESEKGLVPEYYEGDKEYNEVLFDDNHDISSFFFRSSDETPGGDYYKECDVALVFQCDLPALFTSISHRADSEFDNLVYKALESYDMETHFSWISTQHGIAKVYREFDKSKIKYTDMSQRYVVRFNVRARFEVVDSQCN